MSWTLTKRISEGEGAETYLAQVDSETVVLKLLLRPTLPADWAREILFLTRLKHPSLVSLRGCSPESSAIFGKDRGPCYWMDFVDGSPLLDAATNAGEKKIASWLQQGLETLAYLHRNGILHGDISPNNLLVDGDGRLRLLDFGLAGLRGDESRGVAGTFPYIAPEALQGERGEAGDLFSLGTVFFEALTGHHPRSGCRDLQEVIRTVPPALDRGLLGRVVTKMIAVPLAERLSSAEAALGILKKSSKKDGPIQGFVPHPLHSFEMLGAREHFDRLRQAVQDLPRRSRLVAIHGTTGVGKTRFLKEAGTILSLQGITPEPVLLSHPEDLSEDDSKALFHLHERLHTHAGTIAFLEWRDDELTPESRDVWQKVLSWPETLEIFLQPLDEQDAARLIRLALGEIDAKAVRFLLQRSGGNPSLLLQWLAVIRSRLGAAPLSAVLSGLEADAVGSRFWELRLRDLNEDELDLLAFLCAAGEPVERGDLDGRLRSLSSLRERALVREERLRYEPASSLLYEALASKQPERLRRGHEAWRERFASAGFPHLRKLRHAIALNDAVPVAQGLRTTCDHLRSSGRRREAIEALLSGLPLLKDADECSRCLRLKINLLNETGRYEEAERACDEWKKAGGKDEPAAVQAMKDAFIRGFIAANRGRFEDACGWLDRALKLLKKSPTAGYEVRTRALLAKSLIALEDFERADAVLCEAEASDPPPQNRELGEILRNHGLVAARRGRWAEAEGHFLKSAKQYEDAGYLPGIFSTWLQAGLSAVEAGFPEKASDFYARAEEVAEDLKDERSLASTWTNQGVLARKAGHLAAALALAKKSEDIFEFLGNPRDLAAFHRHLGFTLAALGRFDDAAISLQRLAALSPADAEELSAFLDELTEGLFQEAPRKALLTSDDWNLEDNLRWASQQGEAQAEFLKTVLEDILRDLPPEHQVTFMERYDYRRWVKGEKPADSRPEPSLDAGAPAPALLSEITRLNQSLASEQDIPKVLAQLMDSALRLSGAENGCLLIPSETASGALPGFAAAAQRNMSFDSGAPAYSLSAVRRALETRDAVVTDNALQDERFRDAKSVHARNLRSILALPVSANGAVLGVFYLDHRLEDGLFRPATLETMKAFASLAALALQKGRMIEGLKKANAELEAEVSEQSDEVEKLHREVLENRRLLKNEYKDIVGRSPRMMEVLTLLDRITDAKIAVWIYGESGTGKEAVARSLHYNSARAKNAFVTENCSSLPESLLESELFGHKKGSFTQAVQDKKGLLEFAHKGTVFLDEIADMSLNLQSKLLRFLQEGEIRPIGSNQIVKVDVRVVSASNKDLKKLVAEGRFREDLYYRLNGVTVRLPPLRERKEDIPLLADHFLKRIIDRDGLKHLKLEAPVLKFLMKQSWPGNIRQLQNVIETAALFAEKNVITTRALQSVLTETELKSSPAKTALAGGDVPTDLKRILEVIQSECFNRSKAAKTLGMSRRHLYRKLAKYGLNREEDLKGFVEGRTA